MRYEFRLIRKAVSALAVGIAFFLFACQPMMIERIPAGKSVVQDRYDIARKDFQTGHYKEALEGYKNILAEYPESPEVPSIKHDIAEVYYQMGDFKNSVAESLTWLETYPANQLKGEVFILLGNGYNALGDRPEAFRWWLAAADVVSSEYQSQVQQEDIDSRIIDLINWSRTNELKEMAEYGSGSAYIPNIYYRLSIISLEENMIKEAKDYAMLLIRSTQEQHWVTMGRELLDKIEGITKDKKTKAIIGCLLPLSGPYALYGQETLNGIQLAMDLFNQSENDTDIELVIIDTKGSVEDAVAGVEELVEEEEVMAIIGPLASGPATAAVVRSQYLGVPIIGLTQKEGITKERDMVFRNYLTPSKEVEALLDKAVNDIGIKRFGIFYPDNAYGTYFMNLFWDKVEEMDGTITTVESYNTDDTDFEVGIKKMVGLFYPRPESVVRMLEIMHALETLKEEGYFYFWEYTPWNIFDEMEEDREESLNIFKQEGENLDSIFQEEEAENSSDLEEDKEPEPIVDFDAVFIPGSDQQVALIAPQFPFYNVFNVPFLGTSLWLSDDLLDTAGSYIQGAIFPAGFFLGNDSEIVTNFVESYKENFESDPGLLAANGYDTIRLIKDILSNSIISTRIDFQKALLEHDAFPGVTGEISFDEEGEVEKHPVLLTVYGRSFHLLR